MIYSFDIILAFFRIVFLFYLVYGVLAPLLLPGLKQMSFFNRIIFSWNGLNAILLPAVLILTIFRVYDLVSILSLALIMFIFPPLWKNRGNLFKLVRDSERNWAIAIIHYLEEKRAKQLEKGFKIKIKEFLEFKNPYTLMAVLIAFTGGIIRALPVLHNAAPFNRTWYANLDKVTNLNLGIYFGDNLEPKGLHSLINLISTFTRESPEIILHSFGILISVYISLLIYQTIRELTGEQGLIPLSGMAVYAILPALILPLSMEKQIEAHSLDLGLSFVITTYLILLSFLKSHDKLAIYYVIGGIIITGLTNIFLLLMVLLPMIFISLLVIPGKNLKNANLPLIGLVVMLVLLPYFAACHLNQVEFLGFLKEQLFLVSEFSFFPELLLPIESLSIYYLFGIQIAYILFIVIRPEFQKRNSIALTVFFFILFSLPYVPFLKLGYIWIDLDQLNVFYSFLIAVIIGLGFYISKMALKLLVKRQGFLFSFELSVFVLLLGGLLFQQRGVNMTVSLPATLPNEFFEAYYDIISERVPYSYAIVAPGINKTMAKNRHYFMSYEYFLEEYGKVDSLYHEVLLVRGDESVLEQVPPASIFIFVEKPPFRTIQSAILYNSPLVMQNVIQWVESYKNMEGREVKIVLETPQIAVYEIVNMKNKSSVLDLLLNMKPKSE